MTLIWYKPGTPETCESLDRVQGRRAFAALHDRRKLRSRIPGLRRGQAGPGHAPAHEPPVRASGDRYIAVTDIAVPIDPLWTAHVRRIRATRVTKKAVDQPIRMMPLIPSIAETSRQPSAIAASL